MLPVVNRHSDSRPTFKVLSVEAAGEGQRFMLHPSVLHCCQLQLNSLLTQGAGGSLMPQVSKLSFWSSSRLSSYFYTLHFVSKSTLVSWCRWQLDASSQQAQLVEQQLSQQLSQGWPDEQSCRSYLVDMMRTCQQSHVQLPTKLVASIAAVLAKQQWWSALDALLRAQALPLLSQCPGLVQAIVEGGNFALLPVLLPKVNYQPWCFFTSYDVKFLPAWFQCLASH